MNMEKMGGTSDRGPSEAAKQNAIETISNTSRDYMNAEAEILRLNATPDSVEKDEALTVQYGKKRVLGDRLKALGVNPDTLQ